MSTNIRDNPLDNEEQSNNLERATRDQAISALWYQYRITASKAGNVLKLRPTYYPQSLVKTYYGLQFI